MKSANEVADLALSPISGDMGDCWSSYWIYQGHVIYSYPLNPPHKQVFMSFETRFKWALWRYASTYNIVHTASQMQVELETFVVAMRPAKLVSELDDTCKKVSITPPTPGPPTPPCQAYLGGEQGSTNKNRFIISHEHISWIRDHWAILLEETVKLFHIIVKLICIDTKCVKVFTNRKEHLSGPSRGIILIHLSASVR